jgi:2-polyprenyl-3-methyl-5-hydroxy-6-metoxy-1,4-benzoquinol methylase
MADSQRAQCSGCGAADAVECARETAMVRSAFGCRVWRCRRCNLAFAWPRPSAVEHTYEGDYFREFDEAGLAMPAEADLGRYERRLAAVPLTSGRLLDIGVGAGGFLALARRRGWDVMGLDVSRWAAERVRRTHDIDVKVGTLDPETFPASTFDIVHMSHVLEHVADPVGLLRTVRAILTPAGRVIIEVPNELENLYAWVRLRTGTARPYAVASPHLWFFSPRTLDGVVTAAGLRIERQGTFRDTWDPRAVRRVAKRVVGSVERWLDRGSLIEVIAVQ